MIRLFVALSLPDSIKGKLAALATGIPGARWIKPENMHLTLRFIGDIAEDSARDIQSALESVQQPAFDIELAGVGQFGDKKPHTLWAGVRPSAALGRLAAKIEQALQRIGLDPETRRFMPHVTLARLRAPTRDRVGEFLITHSLFRADPFTVKAFLLFSSHQGHEGSHYRAEAEFPLVTPT